MKILKYFENRFFEKPKSRRKEKQKQLIKNFKKNFKNKKTPLKKFSDF
jgi:hypothetical protein